MGNYIFFYLLVISGYYNCDWTIECCILSRTIISTSYQWPAAQGGDPFVSNFTTTDACEKSELQMAMFPQCKE